jgi:hypothetical protein
MEVGAFQQHKDQVHLEALREQIQKRHDQRRHGIATKDDNFNNPKRNSQRDRHHDRERHATQHGSASQHGKRIRCHCHGSADVFGNHGA